MGIINFWSPKRIHPSREKNVTLKWSYNGQVNILTVKLAYQVLYIDQAGSNNWWYSSLWKQCIPYKIKNFIQIILEDGILTWHNLCKIGFSGPNICFLCGCKEQSIYHMFVSYNYSKSLWIYACSICCLPNHWPRDTVGNNS